MKKVLKVEGMMCMHCAGRVKKALEGVGGVEEAAVDLEGKTVTVSLGEDVADKALADAVTQAGYTVLGCEAGA